MIWTIRVGDRKVTEGEANNGLQVIRRGGHRSKSLVSSARRSWPKRLTTWGMVVA